MQPPAARATGMAIPRVIHQTWKDENIPYEIYDRRWVESWGLYHPDWQRELWTDARLRELGGAHYPEYAVMCGDDIPGIFLADFGRYMVLHRFGGLYVDLDYECLKNVEPLLAGHVFVTCYTDDTRQEMNNAFIASIPGHTLLRRYMAACTDRWSAATARGDVDDVGPGPITGPVMMTEVTDTFLIEGTGTITVHESRLLSPIDWRKGLSLHQRSLPAEVIARVREDYPDAYAATYWAHVR